MPNPNRRGNRRSDRNNFFEHDRRGEGVSHMSKGHNKRSAVRLSSTTVKRFFDDDDIDMTRRRCVDNSFNKGSTKSTNQRRRHQGNPSVPRVGYRLPTSPTSWYKVSISYGAKYDKQWVLDSLQTAVAPATFTAVTYTTNGSHCSFYVDNYQGAAKLTSVDNKISCNDGYKLKVLVKPHPNHNVDITEGMKDAIKSALANRFNVATVSLDLSKFHYDPEIIDKYFVPLNSTSVMKSVLAMVVENCPNILGINLSHNMLYSIEGLRQTAPKMPHLKVLHLDHNMISNMGVLDVLKGCDLVELTLNSNPMCSRFPEREAYTREVRNRIPKLKTLDGVELPPPIFFEDENNKVPASRGSYLSEEGKPIVCQFLEQYYAIFDSDSRQSLADAYHEDALLSITNQSLSNDRGKVFYQNSRNLLRVSDSERRNRFLTRGRANIISVLTSLPKTQHDPQSFLLDLSIFTPQLLVLTISGVFRGDNPKMPVKSFFRTLVIVPQNAGFCITNETLFVTTATPRQTRCSFRTSLAPVAPVPAVPSPLVVPVPVAVAPVPIAPIPIVDEIAAKRKMVETLALQSGMNLQWSEKCLTETNWDFNQACLVFGELNKQGRVPAEAFVKCWKQEAGSDGSGGYVHNFGIILPETEKIGHSPALKEHLTMLSELRNVKAESCDSTGTAR